MNHIPTSLPIACTPGTVPARSKERWLELGKWAYGAVEEIRELPDGYALRLPHDAETLLRAAEYVSLDRLCCKFITWHLRVEPNEGAVWLSIAGPEGTKELSRSAFETTDLVRPNVLEAAGLRTLQRRDAVAALV